MSYPANSAYGLTPRADSFSFLIFINGLQAAYDAWRAQATWYIDPVNGVDTATGLTAGTAIKTWKELWIRMGGGPQKDSTIYLLGDLPDTDPMIFDWSLYSFATVVTVDGSTAATVAYSGTYTGIPVVRAPATNTLNKLIDAGVADWTPYLLGDNKNVIMPTSGAASGYPAWVVKKSGGDALVTTYLDPVNYVEAQPAQNDTYDILTLLYVPEYVLEPKGSGQVIFHQLAFGSSTSDSGSLSIEPGGGVQIEFRTCQIVIVSTVSCGYITLTNCGQLSGPQVGSPVSFFAGGLRNEYSGTAVCETEAGSDLAIDLGFVSIGYRMSAVNNGYIRVYEAGFFDSPDNGLLVDNCSSLRVTQAWGSGNVGPGIYIGGSGRLALVAGDLSSITGSVDVSLRGVSKSWADIAAANDYIADTTSDAVITPAT